MAPCQLYARIYFDGPARFSPDHPIRGLTRVIDWRANRNGMAHSKRPRADRTISKEAKKKQEFDYPRVQWLVAASQRSMAILLCIFWVEFGKSSFCVTVFRSRSVTPEPIPLTIQALRNDRWSAPSASCATFYNLIYSPCCISHWLP